MNNQHNRCMASIDKLRVGDQIEFHVAKNDLTGRYRPSPKKTGELRIGTVISRIQRAYSDGYTTFNFACKPDANVQIHEQNGFTGYGVDAQYVEVISPEDIGEIDITNNWYWSGACVIERVIRK